MLPSQLAAQDVASLTGVVTDASGAVVVDAVVKLVDTKTNSSYETKSNAAGAYTFNNLPPGPGYKVTVTKEGFDKVLISNLYLAVNTTHTQNAQLTIGKTTETVEVSALGSAVSLNTTDSTIGNSFDMNMVHGLPVQARDNPTELMIYQPGVVTTAGGGEDATQSRQGSTTGARTDQGNVTVDGLDVNDFAGGFAFNITGNAPVDSIQEFHGETANPLAAEGRGGGAQYNIVTKSGTNEWHGSASEYHRNTVTEANDFFSNLAGVQRPQLIRNQFDTAIGGPIKKDKLFFFFNYEGERRAQEATPTRTVPSDTLRQGQIQYPNESGGTSTASMTDIAGLDTGVDPNTGLPGVNSALLSFINSRYPVANTSSPGSDSLNTGGFRFNAPVHFTENNYLGRIDYNLTNSMKLWGKFSITRASTGDDVNFSAPFLFPGDPLTHLITDKSWSYVFGHTWTIGNTKVNQFIYGQTRQVLGFPTPYNPTGTTQYSNFGGNGVGGAFLTAPFSNGASQARTVPIPVYRDDFNWLHGKHNLQFGGTFKSITTTESLVSDFNSVDVGLGGGVTGLNSSLRPADIATDNASSSLWDTAFTFMLGRFASVSSSFNNDSQLQPLPQGTGHTRNYLYRETELYAQDTWKATSNLTLTYGLRYQFYSVPYETHGLEAIPDTGFNDIINPRIANGLQGNPGTPSNPTAPNTFYNLAGKANHGPGFYSPEYHDFAPRFSFAYNPSFSRDGFLGRVFGDRKTVIRGGAGLVYDHPGINALNFFQDQNTYVLQNATAATYPLNPTGDPREALSEDPRFTAVGTLPPNTPFPPDPVTVPFAPFVDANSGPFGTASNQGLFNYAIDKHLKTPYSELFTLGFQRELPGNLLLDVSYFNRSGHRLLAQSDSGQVVDFKDPASGQFLAAAFGNMAQQVRQDPDGLSAVTDQPFFENQVANALGAPCTDVFGASCSIVIASALEDLVFRGDLGDTVQALDFFGVFPAGVGLAPQFASDLYMTNKGYSNYNGMLMTLHKKYSHGLQFDVNYTYSHSIDNMSSAANNAFGGGSGAGGILCDSINLRVCRANSDFDVTHNISADWIYDVPFGRGRAFGKNLSRWQDEIIGGWQLSGLAAWRTGFAFTTVTSSFPISFANNVPGVFNGDRSAIKTHPHLDQATGQVQLFANPDAAVAAFGFPTGLQAGTRNNLRGPRFSNFNLGIGKYFPITEKARLQFRADAFNAFNHPNFTLPGVSGTADITLPYASGGNFGVIASDSGPRVMQFSLRLEF